MKVSSFLFCLFLVCRSGFADFTNGQAADLVVGGPAIFSTIEGIVVDNQGRLYVSDSGNNRILVFPAGMEPGDAQAPIAILGQTTMAGTLPNKGAAPSATSLSGPSGMAAYSDRLYVADRGNCRVLRYDTDILEGNQEASLVLGQQTFTTSGAARTAQGLNSPYGVALDADHNLWVADSGNARVVRFQALFQATGMPADRVLGQSSLTASGGTTMAFPLGIALDASGALYVTDFDWNHVIRFKSASALGDGSPPDGVLGQSNFGLIGAASGPAGLHTPWGAAVDAQGDLWVADSHNNRVVRYNNAVSKANGAAADLVLGQPNLTSNGGGAGANQMSSPTGVCVTAAGDVWVCDYDNKRVLRFSALAAPKCKIGSASLKTLDGKKIRLAVKGTASGGSGIAFVEFSVNAGKKWLPAKGTTKWHFIKTIKAGALKVQVRAVDTRKIKSPVVKVTGKDFKK